MKNTSTFLTLPALRIAFVIAIILCMSPRTFSAEAAEARAQRTIRTLVDAIRDGDYSGFMKPAGQSFKKAMPEDRFHRVFAEVRHVLKKGYKVEFVADYPEDGRQVYIWKIFPKAVDTELGAILALESTTGEVASFDLQ